MEDVLMTTLMAVLERDGLLLKNDYCGGFTLERPFGHLRSIEGQFGSLQDVWEYVK